MNRLTLLLLLGLGFPVLAQDAPTGPAAALVPFIENGSVAGAVALVADKDKVLSLETVGYSDVKAKTPIKSDAMFWIASMTKPITGVLLMMLVDEGKVKLDDPVEKYLPDFKNVWVAGYKDTDTVLLKKPTKKMTVRHLMTHTSGMPFTTAMEAPTLDHLSIRDAVNSYVITPLDAEPGTKFRYSNAGINTAGRIIEVVSKMKYEDFLDQRLCQPLGMKDTTFWPTDAQMGRLAKAYKPMNKTDLVETTIWALWYPLPSHERQPLPAGGLFSTATDLSRLCRMVLNGGELDGKRYLSEGAVKEMSSRHTPMDLKENWGIGWSITGDTFGHGGAFATDMTIDPKHGLVLVYMVQHNGFPGEGGKGKGAFQKAATEKFAKGK